ncbi:hypothetical protein CK203_095586 [Vitis vinifera]|uniref:Transmembrane protein n=1 Tax=Vitis vinifera TaxID=29760 RepID=A0A438DC12_VITVI|nr:hypothetical protein CK203_095586 [Vitis vinifera]
MDEEDRVLWTPMKIGKFSVKSLYKAVELESSIYFPMKIIWNSWVQPKLKMIIMVEKQGVVLNRWTLPFTVVPTALGTALDINLSNASLVFISVTFATMVGLSGSVNLLLPYFSLYLLLHSGEFLVRLASY